MRRLDLTNERFGALTVIEQAEPIKGRTAWLCRCDCGNVKVVITKQLRNGCVTSCGCRCYQNELRKDQVFEREDLTGQVYGHLTALKHISKNYWLWQCDCGKTKKIRASEVKNGTIVSCGHVQREKVKEIYDNNVFQYYDGSCITTIRPIMEGKTRNTNTSGVTGVRIRRYSDEPVYQARITVRGKTVYLGTFSTLEEAAAARKAAEIEYFKPIVDNWDSLQQRDVEDDSTD